MTRGTNLTTLKALQFERDWVKREIELWAEHDAPTKDLHDLRAYESEIIYKIMRICRGESVVA